jgi:hypothetical protein
VEELILTPAYYVTSDADGGFRHGAIFHIVRNKHGGSISTIVGRFHTWRPDIPPEGYHPHWRIDCYVCDEGFAPDWLAKLLADALVGRGAVSEPLWLGWHRTNEIGGESRGEVFDFD